MPELLELAARCEAAEGADAELDARIWCALNGKRYAEHWTSEYHRGTQVAFTEPPKRTQIVTKRAVPKVTASLDAAMTLVPEGWDWCLSHACDGDEEGSFASLSPARKVTEACGNAATPALALCAAALRARAADHA